MNFEVAHKIVDKFLTDGSKRTIGTDAVSVAILDADVRRAIETVLRTALDKVDPITEQTQDEVDAAHVALHYPTANDHTGAHDGEAVQGQ